MMLKPQDIVVLLKVALAKDGAWAFAPLALDLGMSVSEVHAATQRALKAGLMFYDESPDPRAARPKVRRHALVEFLLHGLRYVFIAERGGETRGVPTAFAAAPLNTLLFADSTLPFVWPDPEGDVRGLALSPLFRSVPQAARRDPALHELLALVDALRIGQARERNLAGGELKKRLEVAA